MTSRFSSIAARSELSPSIRSPIRFAILGVAALGFVVVGLALEGRAEFAPAREALRGREVPIGALGSQRTGKLLRWMGRLHPRFETSGTDRARLRGRSPRNVSFALEAQPPEAMRSTVAVDAELVARGLPVLSVAMSPKDYSSLRANRFRRGQEWERAAYVSYFDEGRLVFATGAGLRLHGGMSRLFSELKSLRLYFREELGAAQFAPGVLFDEGSEPLRRLIVHNDVRTDRFGNDWHFIRPLAFDIAERVGALVPRVSPAILAFNGQERGVVMLTEYLNRHYLQSRYGHDNFVMVRERKNPGDVPLKMGSQAPYDDLWRWLRTLGSSPKMETMAGRVDLDSLTSWFVAVLFCGTSDALQGPVLLDQTDPDARWFWIMWDMDHSFKVEWGWEPGDDPWDVDTFHNVLVNAGTRAKKRVVKLRSHLLQRLMSREEYREALRQSIQRALNHQLTPAFLAERLEHYRALAKRFSVDNSTFEATLGPYFENRGAVLREQMRRHGFAGESYDVHVRIPAGCEARVDGFEKAGGYSGSYFAGSRLRLRAAGKCRKEFSHWRIQAASVREASKLHLALDVEEPLSIELVLRGAG